MTILTIRPQQQQTATTTLKTELKKKTALILVLFVVVCCRVLLLFLYFVRLVFVPIAQRIYTSIIKVYIPREWIDSVIRILFERYIT